MRSGSSLLMHLLSSHPEILGGGERNATYQANHDLWKLALKTRKEHRVPFTFIPYFIDQINHNKFTPKLNLFSKENIQVIFLIRKPAPSISSILNLSKKYYDSSWSEKKATAYYVERLAFLQQVQQQLTPSQKTLIQYESLVALPIPELEKIRQFLNLQSELKESYNLFEFTGKRGDPSQHIQSGKIVETKANLIAIDESLLQKATTAYEGFIANFSNL